MICPKCGKRDIALKDATKCSCGFDIAYDPFLMLHNNDDATDVAPLGVFFRPNSQFKNLESELIRASARISKAADIAIESSKKSRAALHGVPRGVHESFRPILLEMKSHIQIIRSNYSLLFKLWNEKQSLSSQTSALSPEDIQNISRILTETGRIADESESHANEAQRLADMLKKAKQTR